MPQCECGVIYTVDSDEEDIGLCGDCRLDLDDRDDDHGDVGGDEEDE